jgi:hypothetical protein
MKKSLKVLMGAVAASAIAFGAAGEAGATTNWGPAPPTVSAPVPDSNGPSDKVTVQVSIFTTSVWSTWVSNVGPFTNDARLNSSDGGHNTQLVHGTNSTNGNIVIFTPLFTTVVTGQGFIQSN